MATSLGLLFGGGEEEDALTKLLRAQSPGLAAQSERQAALQAAAALLQAGGPSRTPISLGQALGGALQAGQQGYQAAQQQGLQRLMLNLQVQKQLEDARREKAMQEYLTGGSESQAAQGQAAPSTSTQQALGQTSIQPPASALNPQQRQLLALLPPTERAKALGELLKEKKPLVVGDRVLDPFSYKVLFEAPAKPVVVGNSLVDPTTKQSLFTEAPQSPNELRVFQAYLGMSPETQKQFRDFRESSTSKTSINVAMDKFAGELGGALAKNVIDGYGDAQAAQRTIQNIQDARTYVPEMFAGTGANVFLAGAKALNAVGFNIPQVKNTEAFRSAIGQVVLPGLKALGSGQAISNSDRQYMERIVAGDITLDRPSIDEVLNIVERTNRRVIDLHNDKAVRAGNLAKEKGLNFDMTIQTQPSGKAPQNQLPGQPQVKRRRYDPVTKSLVEY
jgi:hypothetical protein